MLRLISPLLLILSCSLFFFSCEDPEEHPAKEVGRFYNIQSNGMVKYKLVTGAENKVISTTMDNNSYYASSGTLHVNGVGNMTIAVRNIYQLWCNGCDVVNPEPLVADTLNMYVHGGSVKLKDIYITGYLGLMGMNLGQHEFSGWASFFNVSTVNLVSVEAFDLVTDSTYVSSTSAINTEVHATKVVNVFIHNAGNVYYKGNPPIVRLTRNGSGLLIKK